MFLEYFRFSEQPFGVTPDPRFLFPSPGHREALASLLYGIETNLGFGTLIAQPGMGKTTLLFHILEQYRQTARTAFIFNTQCNSYDLLRSLLSELDEDASARDTFQLHENFKQVLAAEAQARRRVILVIDEAQNLGDMVMETVRLLSNFESAHLKLLHIILAGQPELAAKLSRPELNQLQQRIPILTHLPRLSPQDIASYIDHRLRVAGYQGTPLFTPEAIRQIVGLSKGIPREINRICFNALSLAYASSKPAVDLAIVEEVAADLGINERVQQEKSERHQPVAVNAGATAPQPRLAEVRPWRPAPGASPAVTATKSTDRTGPMPMPNTGRAAGAVALDNQAHRFPATRQRVRRVSRSVYGLQPYKRPVAYAVFCVMLIAAGWAAMTRWVHPSSAANTEVQDADKLAQAASDASADAKSANGQRSNQPSLPRSVTGANRGLQPATTNPANSSVANNGSGRRQRRKRTNDVQAPALLASARPPTSLPSQQSTTQPVTNSSGPPVHEPTVAAQGQMEFVKYVRPHYPEEARNRHIEGTVVLSAVVAKDGTVRGIKPVSGDPALLKAAESAVRDWVYHPYQINGRAVDVDTEIVINFSLPRKLNP